MQNMEKIYLEYAKTVNKFLFCLTHDTYLSEELTQETFFIAIKKINTFKGQSKLSVWLCQIAKNLWYNELKKEKKKLRISNSELDKIPYYDYIDDIIIENEERRNLYNKIGRLDENFKQIILLRIVGEMSFKEIGEVLNQTENWARVNFYRAKQKLKEELKNEGF